MEEDEIERDEVKYLMSRAVYEYSATIPRHEFEKVRHKITGSIYELSASVEVENTDIHIVRKLVESALRSIALESLGE